jgi:16S rRNA (uracil1498-N3)-methyltransferase
MRRFYAPNLQKNALDAGESHHFLRVLRGKIGDRITVFDGKGREMHAEVTEISRDAVKFRAISEQKTPPLPIRVTLAQAIPKKNFDLIVQKAAELGVSSIVPLISERTLKRPAVAPERWREIALEACKQSGNNWLPSIESPQKVSELVPKIANFDMKLIASLQPDAQNLKKILESAPKNLRSVVVFVGPEGDFTPAELALAKSAGCLPLSLGPLVLRAETAAIYTLSILHHELQGA